jgi:iron complex transport system ATP-binding protein
MLLALKDGTVERGGRQLLSGVSFEAKPGQLLGLLGPNGAGKTTTVRALLGLQPLTNGIASFDGKNVAQLTPGARALSAAYLPQSRQLAWPIAVREVVALGRFAHGGSLGRLSPDDLAAVEAALEKCDLTHLAGRSVAQLSGGELARVHIARAFASSAPALIADEPTSALDPGHAFEVLDLLKAKAKAGGTVIVILHDLILAARYCDEIILMDHGSIVCQGPPAVALSIENIGKFYGVRAVWDKAGLTLLGGA